MLNYYFTITFPVIDNLFPYIPWSYRSEKESQSYCTKQIFQLLWESLLLGINSFLGEHCINYISSDGDVVANYDTGKLLL